LHKKQIKNKPNSIKIKNKKLSSSLVARNYIVRLCLGLWRREERKDIGGQKYREKLINLSHFLKDVFFFLQNDKLILKINIFFILRIL